MYSVPYGLSNAIAFEFKTFEIRMYTSYGNGSM